MKMKYKNITQRLDIITRHLTETRKIILLNFIIMFLASCIILPASSTFAESFQSNERVEFNLNPSISLSISGDLTIENLSPGDSKDSNIITVTATSNAIAGYNVSSTVGNNTHNYTTLNHSSNSNVFTNLSSNISSLTSFNDNTWGYSWCDGTCTSSTAATNWKSGAVGATNQGYNGLPLCNQANVADCSGITLIDETTNGTKTISFKIGAKASSTQAAGTYSNVVNFVSVANPNPEPPKTMQEATLADCGKTMIDSRDGNSYTTALINEQCWMTKNLDLPGGTTLTSADSNVTSNYTLPASSTSGFYDESTAYVYNSGRTDCSTSPGCYSYYSWKAATAGSSPSSGNSSVDICPKGWRLPTKAEFDTLKSSYDTGAKLIAAPFLGVYAGYYDNSSFDDGGSYGYYWSSTAYDSSDAYLLYFGSSDANTVSNSKYFGLSIRCVAKS